MDSSFLFCTSENIDFIDSNDLKTNIESSLFISSSFLSIGGSVSVTLLNQTSSCTEGQIVISVLLFNQTKEGHPISFSILQVWNLQPIATQTISIKNSCSVNYQIQALPSNYYYGVFAYYDSDSSNTLNLDKHEALGWYRTNPSGWIAPIYLKNTQTNINLILR